MADTTSRVQSALLSMLDQAATGDLQLRTGLKEQKNTRRAAQLGLPSVLENMGNLSRSPNGSALLWEMLERSSHSVDQGEECAELAAHLFGDRLTRAAEQLANRVGISQRNAVVTLEALSGWTLTKLAGLAEDHRDPDALRRLLVDHGAQYRDVAASFGAVQEAAQQSAAEPVLEPRTQSTAAPQSNSPEPLPEPKRVQQAPASGGQSTKLVGALVVGLLLLAGAAFALFGGGGGDSAAEDSPPAVLAAVSESEAAAAVQPPAASTETEAAQPPAASTEAETSPLDAADPEAVEESEPSDTAAITPDEPNVVAVTAPQNLDPTITALSVPLRDITDNEPDAEGRIDFTFNKVTGEICFEVGSFGVQPPYAAHIHAGDFGIKGGVVADLGLLEPDSNGCISSLAADTAAILAEPSRHYAELHDAGGEWTVRGQLSETVDKPGIVPFTIPMRDILGTSPNSSGVLNFDFNTLTGEICYSVIAVGVSPPFAGHIHAGGFGIKGGVVLDLGNLDNGNEGCVQNDLGDTLAILTDLSGHYAELHDAGGEWTVRGQLSETIDNPGVVTMAVPMVDITNVEPSAEGTLAFDFNTVTGEICYDVTAVNVTAPFDAHIHAGDYGVKGGVVVDLGGLEDGSGGCVNNEPGDTLAILADPAGHYAELHDAAGVWTIRGQLSEASAPIDPSATNLLIDTDGGGASIRLQQGTIFLEGVVASEAVADEITASLAGIATPVVNNLIIVEGAPVPSGRVLIGDNVFFETGSDRIKDLDLGTVRALVELANSRPDWVMTIVGHTDNIGGDVYNLELSLRRAQALRDVLVAQGMNSDNMRIRGAGETAPIGDNATEAGRAENRRIEFEFTPQ